MSLRIASLKVTLGYYTRCAQTAALLAVKRAKPGAGLRRHPDSPHANPPYSVRVVPILSLALGALLALCGLPLPWSFLTPLPLAGVLWLISSAPTARNAALRAWLAGSAYFTIQLLWLPQSFGGGFGPLGALMFIPLYLLEGGFLAGMAWLVARLVQRPGARLWGLAGAWVVLEWLRHLGPLAFPWGTLGYTALPTPAVQIADLGGVLLLSLLMTASAAALAQLARGHWRPLAALALVWAGAGAYGLTRTAGVGEEGRALLLRTDYNSFDEDQYPAILQTQRGLSTQSQPGELVIWSESAIREQELGTLPTPAISGVYFFGQVGLPLTSATRAVAWDGQIRGQYDKFKRVPFGEYFPLARPLNRVYQAIFTGFRIGPFDPPHAGTRLNALPLNGARYGTYICYDSVFPQVAAGMVRDGADVLVNISNDGWYVGWGVTQHFLMGRLRAIETRRFVMRSVNRGVAAVVDDLGRVQQRLDTGNGVLHARYRRLSGQTVYVRYGDWPALILAGLLILGAVVADRRREYLW